MKSRILTITSFLLLIAGSLVAQTLGIPWGMSAVFLLMWLIAALLPLRGAENTIGAAPPPRLKRQLLYAVVVMSPFPPLLILLHELGHYLAVRHFGYGATFTYAEIIIHAERVKLTEALWITAGGPLVELTFAIVGIACLWRYSRSPLKHPGPGLWIFTAFSFAGFRWLRTNFSKASADESKLIELLGAPGQWLPPILVTLALLVAAVILGTHRRHRTLVPLAAGFAAAAVSAVLWLTWLGPIVLPHPSKPSWKETPASTRVSDQPGNLQPPRGDGVQTI